ncbi:hypothetical protein KIN20_028960 [Parelaphostrongylus tenuis]|uniref:Reverse transcriptase domain-containing protein n=1 Tax=Parelaphostrongylus tenuis TaxID=148309 RepID=A0AAD5R1Y4_PARTN|nr:hypothetical protein KIN20_028960 [Parelaphostrongylus tenuis]
MTLTSSRHAQIRPQSWTTVASAERRMKICAGLCTISEPGPFIFQVSNFDREKVVRFCGTIYPKLFTAIQWTAKPFEWDQKGMLINGNFLLNFRFTDDIVIFPKSTSEAETVLKDLNGARKRTDLRIQLMKAQFIHTIGALIMGHRFE